MNGINDLRSYSKVWVKDFILTYKKESCLWQTSHPDYNNSLIRNESYDKLVKKLREVESDPDRNMVLKKVNSLRSAFRREYRKKMANQNYEPKLWYFDILSFIAEQSPGKKIKNGRKSKLIKTELLDQSRNLCVEEVLIDENHIDHLQESEHDIDEHDLMEDEHDSSLNIKQENIKQQMRVIKISNMESQESELQEAVSTIEDQQSQNSYHEQHQQHHHTQQQQEIQETHHPQSAVTHSIQSIQLSKEQLNAILNPTATTTNTSQNSVVSGNNYMSKDEFDAIGINVASKLRCMNSTQRIIAEKLISDVLFNGQLDILSITSKIISN